MLRAAVAKGGVDVVAVNDPFLDANYMVSFIWSVCADEWGKFSEVALS